MRLGSGFYGKVRGLRDRLSRARYFRGHGVHSPYVFGIVREVFMRRTLLSGSRELYDALLAAGIAPHRAVQLQNLCTYCGYESFVLNGADAAFCVATCELSAPQTLTLVRAASAKGHTVALLSPCEGRERQALCCRIIAEHPSTTVDNRGYLLLFNNHLPKQHYRI